MKTTRRIAPLSWLACLLLCATSCGSGTTPEARIDAPVRTTLSADPASLSLLGKMDRSTEILAFQITDSLVQFDETLELRPRVAESWELSADRTTLTFRLRDGVRWHDGQPVTADDVAFTVETVREPATENRTYAPGFEGVSGIEAIDPRTVVAHYETIHPGFLEAWRVPLLPRHLAGRDADLLTGEFARHPVGCGPFRFVSYRPGQEIVLEANPDYWDGAPTIEELVFKIYPDQRTAYQALLLGELDLLKVSPDHWYEAMNSDAADRLDYEVFAPIGVYPLVWNQSGANPFFTDARVRKAMMYALDRETFIETVAHGQARPGVTVFHPDTTWADPQLEPRAYDPELAARLLDEAGWIDHDGDGIRDKDGAPFRFTLLLPVSTMELTRQIALWQQAAWAELGIDAEIERLEFQAFRERRDAGDFDAVSFYIGLTPDPDQFYDLFHSSAARDGWNFYGLNDPVIDELLDEARRTFDPERRRELYGQLQFELYEKEPIGWTFMFNTPILFDRRLRGVEPTPLGIWLTTKGPRLWHWAGPVGD
jgi:peptide/nickel transport system substrate-binding protein